MEHNPKLSSSELANLWSSYMADSMNICVMNHFLDTVEDKEIMKILKYSKKLSEKHLVEIESIFTSEKIPIPQGYDHTDVVRNTPKVFSDLLFLHFLESMGRNGTNISGMALGTSYRKEIKSFYITCLKESGELYDRVTRLLAEKGTLVRTPYIPYPVKVEFIQSKKFLAGYLTQNKRPLTAIEITHISNNIESNIIGGTLILGFAQLAENEEVKKYFQDGIQLNRKIISSLNEMLSEDHVSSPFPWDSTVTDSTISPFSDKLMMGMISSLNSISIGTIGQGMATSMRSDILANYTSLVSQISKYAHTGAKLSIKNGWVEKPPHALDREEIQGRT